MSIILLSQYNVGTCRCRVPSNGKHLVLCSISKAMYLFSSLPPSYYVKEACMTGSVFLCFATIAVTITKGNHLCIQTAHEEGNRVNLGCSLALILYNIHFPYSKSLSVPDGVGAGLCYTVDTPL